MADQTQKQADAVKARLAPWLNEPYFEVVESYMAFATPNRCTHENMGVRLDEIDRRVYCLGCKIQLDPFEALLYHAKSERRLLSQLHDLKERERAEAAKIQREKERRPHLKRVLKRRAVRDTRMKDEPVVGYVNELECGHKRKSEGANQRRTMTCLECVAAAKGPTT